MSLSLYAWSVKANIKLSCPNRDSLLLSFLSSFLPSFPTFFLTRNSTADDEVNPSTLVNTYNNPLKKLKRNQECLFQYLLTLVWNVKHITASSVTSSENAEQSVTMNTQ